MKARRSGNNGKGDWEGSGEEGGEVPKLITFKCQLCSQGLSERSCCLWKHRGTVEVGMEEAKSPHIPPPRAALWGFVLHRVLRLPPASSCPSASGRSIPRAGWRGRDGDQLPAGSSPPSPVVPAMPSGCPSSGGDERDPPISRGAW